MVASTRSTGSPGNPATTTPKAPTSKTPLAAVVPTEPGLLMRVGMLVDLPTGGDSSGARRRDEVHARPADTASTLRARLAQSSFLEDIHVLKGGRGPARVRLNLECSMLPTATQAFVVARGEEGCRDFHAPIHSANAVFRPTDGFGRCNLLRAHRQTIVSSRFQATSILLQNTNSVALPNPAANHTSTH